jgi:hypothetical protein
MAGRLIALPDDRDRCLVKVHLRPGQQQFPPAQFHNLSKLSQLGKFTALNLIELAFLVRQ